MDKEGPRTPLYHEFKDNRHTHLAFIPTIKINCKHTIGVEEIVDVLITTLISDDSVSDDYYREIRSQAGVPSQSPMSDLS